MTKRRWRRTWGFRHFRHFREDRWSLVVGLFVRVATVSQFKGFFWVHGRDAMRHRFKLI